MYLKALILICCVLPFGHCQNEEAETTNLLHSTSAYNEEISTELNIIDIITPPSLVNSTVFPITNTILSNTSEIQVTTPTPASIQCPSECKCAASLTDAVCIDKGLVTIPNGFSSKVKILILTSNNITEIGEDTFRTRNLFELMSLLINHNRIKSLHPNAFVVLKHLEVLDLGDNSLTILDPSLFINNTALITLRLDNNTHLQLPSQGALINAPSLRDLNISSCNITDLPIHVFSGTPTLETIDLSGNNLKDLDPNVLQYLPELIKLILPTSFEPKSSEICKAYPKLEKIILFNKGNEEIIECSLFTSNIEEKKVELDIPLNGNSLPNQEPKKVEDKIINGDTNGHLHGTPTIIKNFSIEIPVPVEERQISRMTVAKQINDDATKQSDLKVEKLSDQTIQKASSFSLSGPQIDNIIIGILLTVIVITTIAIVINLKKKEIKNFTRKYRKSSRTQNEPEGEPLRNMAASP